MDNQRSSEAVRTAISDYYKGTYRALETLGASLFQARGILDSIDSQELDLQCAYSESNRIWQQMLDLSRQASIEQQAQLETRKSAGAASIREQIGLLTDRLEACKQLSRTEHKRSLLESLPEVDYFSDPELYSALFSGASDYRYFPSFEVREVLSGLQKSARKPLEDALKEELAPFEAAVESAREAAITADLRNLYQQAVTRQRDLEAALETQKTRLREQYLEQRRIAIGACGQELSRLRAALEATLADLFTEATPNGEQALTSSSEEI